MRPPMAVDAPGCVRHYRQGRDNARNRRRRSMPPSSASRASFGCKTSSARRRHGPMLPRRRVRGARVGEKGGKGSRGCRSWSWGAVGDGGRAGSASGEGRRGGSRGFVFGCGSHAEEKFLGIVYCIVEREGQLLFRQLEVDPGPWLIAWQGKILCLSNSSLRSALPDSRH